MDKPIKNRVLKIWGNLGSNGGCIQECKNKNCDGESNECKAWDHLMTITPNTPITLQSVFGEHLAKDTEFKITLESVQYNFENAKINLKHLIKCEKDQ